MSKVLSQEEIDALLSSVNEGANGSTIEAKSLKKKKISIYDFRRPNLISKEQFRLLNNIHEALVRKIAVFLSAQLKMIVEMNLIGIDQIMYSEFVMSITSPAALYVGEFDDPHSRFILELSPQFVAFTIERLFGGKGTYVNSNHYVSTIERKIMQRVVDKIAYEISKNWAMVKKFNCRIARFEHNAEFVQIAPASEPVVVVSIEVKFRDNTTMLNICYPYVWISDILSNPELQQEIMLGNEKRTEHQKRALRRNVEETEVNLKAILGKSRISINDFIGLKVGDVLRLSTHLNDSIPVYVHDRKVLGAHVGKSKNNYSLKICEIEKGVNYEQG